MWIKKSWLTYVTALGLVSGISAIAQDKMESESKRPGLVKNIQKECKSDLDKYCKDVSPGDGKIASCLDSRGDQLSPSCKKAWTGAKAQISDQVDSANLAFRNSCGKDVQKFCKNEPSGRGRLLTCLDGHRNDLSSSCQRFYTVLEKRLSEVMG
jgi:hypothetical protein